MCLTRGGIRESEERERAREFGTQEGRKEGRKAGRQARRKERKEFIWMLYSIRLCTRSIVSF